MTGTDETRFTALCPCGQLVEWVAGLAQDGRTGAAPVVHDCASTPAPPAGSRRTVLVAAGVVVALLAAPWVAVAVIVWRAWRPW